MQGQRGVSPQGFTPGFALQGQHNMPIQAQGMQGQNMPIQAQGMQGQNMPISGQSTGIQRQMMPGQGMHVPVSQQQMYPPNHQWQGQQMAQPQWQGQQMAQPQMAQSLATPMNQGMMGAQMYAMPANMMPQARFGGGGIASASAMMRGPQMVGPQKGGGGMVAPNPAMMRGPQIAGMMPPAYTPDMAKEFQSRQQILQREQAKIIEKQRKKMEQEFKQRQFQETQKRLKEYATIGGRKLDVDMAIHTIIGSPEHKSHHKSHGPTQDPASQPASLQSNILQPSNNMGLSQTAPGQSAFPQMTPGQSAFPQAAPGQSAFPQTAPGQSAFPQMAPSQSAFPQTAPGQSAFPQAQTTPISSQPAPVTSQVQPDDDFADFMSCPTPAVNQSLSNTGSANEASHNKHMITSTNQNTTIKKEDKKDLTSMMFECSDLSTPKEAKSFKTHQALKDVQPVHRAATFRQSERARTWSDETQQLSELFTVPEPELPPPSPSQPVPTPSQPGGVVGATTPGLHQSTSAPATQQSSLQAPRQQVPSGPGHPLPAGARTPGSPGLPAWLTGKSPVPEVYNMVLEAVTRDHKIDTGMLYPILMRSDLPKDVLGHLWKLCNKQTPGQLVKQELYMLLAMVCVAQNNLNIQTLDILLHCPQAPVPNLGQHQTQPDPSAQSGDHGVQVKAASEMSRMSGSVHVGSSQTAVTSSVAGIPQSSQSTTVPPIGRHDDDDDFADFKSANIAAPVLVADENDDFGDFKSVPVIPTVHQPSNKIPTIPQAPRIARPPSIPQAVNQSTIPQSDRLPMPPKSSTFPQSDRLPMPQPSSTIPTGHESTHSIHKVGSDLMGENDKYAAFRLELASSPKDGADSLFIDRPTKPTDDTESNFADFSAFKDSSSSSDFQSFSSTPSSANQDLTVSSHDSFSPPNNRRDNWGSSSSSNQSKDNKSGLESAEDDFGEFIDCKKAESKSNSMRTPDKLSAIKALVMDTKLYSDDKPQPITAGDGKEDDWDPFVTSSGDNSTTPVIDQTPPSWKVEAPTSRAEPEGEGWANFSSAAPSVTTTTRDQAEDDFGDFHSKPVVVTGITAPEQPRMKVDPKKANSIFGHNMVVQQTLPHSSSGTGMSALDTEPPELPDFHDDDDHHVSAHDKFGTFQGHSAIGFDLDNTNGVGISSLVTPYGGFDDQVEESTNKKALYNGEESSNKELSNHKQFNNVGIPNSQSASSFEFTGWSNQSKGVLEGDSISMKSLDLKNPQSGEGSLAGVDPQSQDGSPAGIDSQSVSSLDLNDIKKTAPLPLDQRSLGSLDLKSPVETGEDGSEAIEAPEKPGGTTEHAGSVVWGNNPRELNKPPVFQEPGKAFDASEILTSELPINMPDRYSSLMAEPEDSDRHLYSWDKCLQECYNILQEANTIFNNIPNIQVCREVLECQRGIQYIEGVTEIYRVACRIKLAMHSFAMSSDDLEERQKEIHNQWNNLVSFITNSKLMPTAPSLSFKKALVKKSDENLTERWCGICLLDADVYSDSTTTNQNTGNKLSYGGRNYHAPCANLWVNRVDSTLPSLKVTELF